MKTLVIWTEIPEEAPRFCLVEGNVAKFSNHYINGMADEELEKEMLIFFYGEEYDTEPRFKFELNTEAPNKDKFDAIVACGFIC